MVVIDASAVDLVASADGVGSVSCSCRRGQLQQIQQPAGAAALVVIAAGARAGVVLVPV